MIYFSTDFERHCHYRIVGSLNSQFGLVKSLALQRLKGFIYPVQHYPTHDGLHVTIAVPSILSFFNAAMINISRRHVRGVCIFGGSLLVAIILYVAFPFQYRAQHVSRISSFLSSTKLPTNHETLISPVSPNNFTRTSATYSTPNASSQPTVVAIPIQSWEFNHSRDAGGFGLTSEQCNLAFPGLFTEINRAVEYRENIGAVTPKDLDTTWKKEDIFRASIVDQQVGNDPNVMAHYLGLMSCNLLTPMFH